MASEKSYRNTKGDDFKGHRDPKVAEELKKLFRSGVSDRVALQKLRSKYKDDDMVHAIFDAYKERQEVVLRKAKKFKQLIFDRYAPLNLSFEEMLKKAKKYQKKYRLSDDEFHYFVTLSLTDKAISPSMQLQRLPNTPLAKTLGYDLEACVADRLKVKDSEIAIVQEILRLYGETKGLHAQVVLQALEYRDCAPEAITGKYNKEKHNVYAYVHPVLAALFLPKFKLLDDHLLIANIGYIIQCKYEGKQIMTKPDYELYWDLITDPNEHACTRPTDDSPIKDLRNRYLLQTKVWESVLNLRQGRYYNDSPNDFLLAIDNCKSNIYDSPDLAYVKDEGAIIRRLLAAFALRPTMVTTTRLYGVMSGEAHGFSAAHHQLSAAGISQITSVPMVTLRLPLDITKTTTAISLEDSLTQPQWFVENKMIIPKAQSIIHSRDILVFYVGRRYKTVNITKVNTPCNFNNLPMTVAGWEAVNDRPVFFQQSMPVRNDVFRLRSVVMVESSTSNKNLIVGSTTGIIIPRDIRNNVYEETFLLYDPQSASEQFRTPAGTYTANDPITCIPGVTPFNSVGNVESFAQRASTRGTIFIYQKEGGEEGDCSLVF